MSSSDSPGHFADFQAAVHAVFDILKAHGLP